MSALFVLIGKGGPVMFAIIALSVVLYSRCFMLVLGLRRSRRQLRGVTPVLAAEFAILHRMQDDTQDEFRQQRVALGSMIAAAPLLGLLGTVSGLVRTFESLSALRGAGGDRIGVGRCHSRADDRLPRAPGNAQAAAETEPA